MNVNFQEKLDNIIEETKRNNKIPTLLLHSCCAPCSSYVLEYLSNHFFITIYYYNPNIYPANEYNRRLIEQKEFISKLDTVYPIKFIEGDYDTDKYNKIVMGLEGEPEGGKRCFECYRLRLEEAAKVARNLKYDYFTTTLSISPYKNSKKINEIGEILEKKYNVKYLYADFKKRNGYKRSIELSKKYNLYRQEYCGCKYSIRINNKND